MHPGPEPLALNRNLFNCLRDLPFKHKFRYTETCEQELISILFHHLTNLQSGFLHSLFGGEPRIHYDRLSLSEAQGAVDGAEYTPAARGKPCGHIFQELEATYSCRTCTTDDTCVLCAKCFEASDHEGHHVVVSLSGGTNGCCDCGDEEAWNRPINCTIHAPLSEAETNQMENDEADATSTSPVNFQRAIRITISGVLDFMCDVFSCSPEFSRRARSPGSVSQDEAMGRLAGGQYFATEQEEECTEYALVLWNDEKHTLFEVQNQVNRACSQSSAFGERKAKEVDRVGRSIIEYSSNLPDLLRKARILEQIKVTVTVRSARDTFREQMCGTMVEWLNDIAGCSVGDDHNILTNTICEELLRPWRIGSRAFNLSIGKNGLPDEAKSDDRLQQRVERSMRARMVIARDTARQARDTDPPTQTDTLPRVVLARHPRRRDNEDENDPDGSDEDDDDEQNDDEMDVDETDGGDSDDEQETNTNQRIGWGAPGGFEDVLVEHGLTFEMQNSGSQEDTPQDSEDETPEPTPQNNPDDLLANDPSKLTRTKTSKPLTPSHWLVSPKRDSKAKHAVPIEEDLSRRVRIDFLVLYDMRMWKSLRNNLRSLYITSVVRIPRFKRLLGLRFAAVYNWLSQLYLVADREPDLSIINLSLQMFTTPSITAEVVERGNFLTQLLAILYTYFTERSVGKPENVDVSAPVAFEAGVMTNRRIHHFFNDLKYLLESSHVKKQVRGSNEYLLQFIDYITLYQGICPSVRTIGDHVEYESEAFISAAGVTRDVTRITRHFFEAFDRAESEDPISLGRALEVVAKAAILSSLGVESKRPTPKATNPSESRFTRFKTQDWFPMEERGKEKISQPEADSRRIVNFCVESEPMSFYHPLHHALSWLIEGGKNTTPANLRTLLSLAPEQLFENQDPQSIPQYMLRMGSIDHWLALFDIPLRVCAWTAQIRAGMWIRNGMTLRHQLSTYRSMGQRDATVQRDYFLLQVAFAICPKDHFLASAIDRFGMSEWMRCDYDIKPRWDDHQMIDVCEEFIHLLIIILSDRALLHPGQDRRAAEEFIAKREIAHTLCFKPMSHSDLSDRLTLRVTELENFEDILAEVTKFRPPDGLHDSGIFELKEENYHLIDPYNAYFNKNQREEAENAWRQRKAKSTGRPFEQVVCEPSPAPITSGIFRELGAFTQTPLFAQVIFSSLQIALLHSIGDLPVTRFEAFLPTALHLLLLGLNEDWSQEGSRQRSSSLLDAMFSVGLSGNQFQDDTIFTQLLKLLKHDQYANSKAKLRLILGKLQANRPVEFEKKLSEQPIELRDIQLGSRRSDNLEDLTTKKRQAQERQAKVMAAFKKQQNDFLKTQNIDWGDDEWDELENEMDMGGSGVTKDIWNYPRDTCILCQEETNDQRLYGSLAYIDQSHIFRQTNVTDKDHVQEVDATPINLDYSAEDIRPFGMAGNNVEHVQKTSADGKIVTMERRGLGKGWDPACTSKIPLTTGCGHLMHFSCFEGFNAATERRHNYQIARLHPERLGQNEFVCPLCKALGNSFLPIVWKPMETVGPTSVRTESFDQWITAQAPFLVSRAFDRTTYEKSYSSYIDKSLIQAYSSKLTAPAQPRPSFTESRTSSLNIPSFLTRSRPTMPLRDPHAAVSRSQDGQDGPTAELLKAYRRLQQTMQAMGLQSIFGLAGTPQVDAGPSYVNQINAEPLANALGGSIANVEIAQRGVDSSGAPSFIEKIPEQTIAHLRVFSATCSSFIAVYGMYQSPDLPDVSVLIRRQVVQLFGAREESFQNADNNGRETLSSASSVAPLLHHDSFLFYASCTVFMNPLLHLEQHHVMRLCYLAEMVKIILAFIRDPRGHIVGAEHLSSNAEKEAQFGATSRQSENFTSFVQDILMQLDQSQSKYGITDEDGPLSTRNLNERYYLDKALRNVMMTYLLPFVRKCLLLTHIRNGIDYSNALPENPSSPELYRVLRLMGLPLPDDLIEAFLNPNTQSSRTLHNYLQHWLDHLTFHQLRGHDWPWYRAKLKTALDGPNNALSGGNGAQQSPKMRRINPAAEDLGDVLPDRHAWTILSLPHPGIYELIALPYKHDTLNAEIVSRRCPTTGRQLQDPVLCLFCGAIFCSQASCCSVPLPRKTVGGCYQHLEKCGGGHIGMFLNIHKCAVLMLNGDHGSWFSAPYLDAYGETDWGLKRKGILYLNRRRYDRLFRDVWLSGGVPSAVARKLEGDVNNGGWETL